MESLATVPFSAILALEESQINPGDVDAGEVTEELREAGESNNVEHQEDAQGNERTILGSKGKEEELNPVLRDELLEHHQKSPHNGGHAMDVDTIPRKGKSSPPLDTSKTKQPEGAQGGWEGLTERWWIWWWRRGR